MSMMTLVGYYTMLGIFWASLMAFFAIIMRHAFYRWKLSIIDEYEKKVEEEDTDEVLILGDTSDLSLDEYQVAAESTAIYPEKGNNIYYPAMGLAGEAGEVCNVVKKIQRDCGGLWTQEHRDKIKKETGDVMWYLALLAREFDLSFSEIAQANIEKLADRKKRNVLQGSGDER